jgi:hypothetical protein
MVRPPCYLALNSPPYEVRKRFGREGVDIQCVRKAKDRVRRNEAEGARLAVQQESVAALSSMTSTPLLATTIPKTAYIRPRHVLGLRCRLLFQASDA